MAAVGAGHGHVSSGVFNPRAPWGIRRQIAQQRRERRVLRVFMGSKIPIALELKSQETVPRELMGEVLGE